MYTEKLLPIIQCSRREREIWKRGRKSNRYVGDPASDVQRCRRGSTDPGNAYAVVSTIFFKNGKTGLVGTKRSPRPTARTCSDGPDRIATGPNDGPKKKTRRRPRNAGPAIFRSTTTTFVLTRCLRQSRVTHHAVCDVQTVHDRPELERSAIFYGTVSCSSLGSTESNTGGPCGARIPRTVVGCARTKRKNGARADSSDARDPGTDKNGIRAGVDNAPPNERRYQTRPRSVVITRAADRRADWWRPEYCASGGLGLPGEPRFRA